MLTSCEVWRDIPGYEGKYQASSLGRIRSLDRVVKRRNWSSFRLPGRVLKPRLSHKGYLLVGLCTEARTKNYSVHRLVARAFIPNPKGKPEINHRNGDKTDNRVENLEWVTTAENVRHSITVLGHTRSTPTYAVVCLDTGHVYASAREAAAGTGCRRGGISAVCRGEKKTHHGLRWAYKGAEA